MQNVPYNGFIGTERYLSDTEPTGLPMHLPDPEIKYDRRMI